MNLSPVACLGWGATAVFVGSYFCQRAALLRSVQMFGALMWVVYGALIHASPVIVANLLVFSAAAWTTFRRDRGREPEGRDQDRGRTGNRGAGDLDLEARSDTR
jgi:membrane protein implicated in regulation of membrane protease activity